MTSDTSPIAVEARGLSHRYGERVALDGVDFVVAEHEIRGFLGPNGSGKSTLFKVLATLLPVQSGTVTVFGRDLGRQFVDVRRDLGVVFQSPALDRKLTVRENLRYSGALYGLAGADLERRIDEVLDLAALGERGRDPVAELSGGLRRRVEIAKAFLHRPRLLLLDEPTTGLDPAARQELWQFLRGRDDITVLFTTHLMDEAELADRLTILNEGRVVADATPDELRGRIGGEVLELIVAPARRASFAESLATELGVSITEIGGAVRIESATAHDLVPDLMRRFGDDVERLTLSRPTLEDVFLALTGERLES